MLTGALTLSLVLFNSVFADDHDEQDMPPGAQEFFQTLQETQGNFDAAFNAAEAVAKADAEANDPDYDAEEWEKCKNEAFQAMQEAIQYSQADNMEDKARDVFGATMFAAQLCSGDLPPEEQAFFTAIKSNEDPQSAFDAAAEAAMEVAKQDIEEDGGTAVYDGEWITNDENMSLLYPVEERFNLERVIPAKFNRAVIFPGNRMLGAYIDDYNKYKDNWRFTQVLFYQPIT